MARYVFHFIMHDPVCVVAESMAKAYDKLYVEFPDYGKYDLLTVEVG